ncbi:integrase catalytic domain-containing protein [Mycolicibacterium vinylchloridicum]|uniref:integrase catalytic domain-containing protein n=1 Tax=Mycolicibacterium vinylchloridicum TaxID=2736928 RepID=UPI0015CBEF47|nr:hypothetical protein [Mycolicibacterium vinylchloridicum]
MNTRGVLLNLVEHSITGKALVEEFKKMFAARGGPPKVLRLNNGSEMVSQALQRFCDDKTGIVHIPPGWEVVKPLPPPPTRW